MVKPNKFRLCQVGGFPDEGLDSYTSMPYNQKVQTVIETEEYLKDAKRAGLSNVERGNIVDFIADNPTAGNEIKGTGGARKLRFAAKGKG